MRALVTISLFFLLCSLIICGVSGYVPNLLASEENYNVYSYNGGENAVIEDNGFNVPFPSAIDEGETFAGSDVVSYQNFTISRVVFDAQFNITNFESTETEPLNEMVVFFTNNIVSYKGLEIGVVAYFSNGDGEIWGYYQDGLGVTTYLFEVVELIDNDLERHHYEIDLSESDGINFFTWKVDGVIRAEVEYESDLGSSYASNSYNSVYTCHRVTEDWDATGTYLLAGNLAVTEQETETETASQWWENPVTVVIVAVVVILTFGLVRRAMGNF